MRVLLIALQTCVHVLGFTDVPPKPSDDKPSDAPMTIEIIEPPPASCEKKASPGDLVSVHYTGWSLKTAIKFDSSRDRKSPFEFSLGAGRVIKGTLEDIYIHHELGWDQGVEGMCVGEVRRLTIPSGLAYGKRGYPPVISPDATLVFNVELKRIDRQADEL